MNRESMKQIQNQRFGEERALYESRGVWVQNCRFDGEEDGESALKESQDIVVEDCYCNLRYPFWHDTNLVIRNTETTEACRAALWYSTGIVIENSRLHGTKALRECSDIHMRGCDIVSAEFGWSVKNYSMENSSAAGEYFLLRAENVHFSHVNFSGKYSFQYVKNVVLEDCVLDTKDAFWHAENVTLRRCMVKGAYLAWYAKNIVMEDCILSGTQPFCYCQGLKLVRCALQDADLCFEKSDVEATLTTPVISIKNPARGSISLPALGELICTDARAQCRVVVNGEQLTPLQA